MIFTPIAVFFATRSPPSFGAENDEPFAVGEVHGFLQFRIEHRFRFSVFGLQVSEEHEARLQQMEAAIAGLSEQDQQLLRLQYYEQMKTADIAHQTGLSQSNVLVKLHRIRERLKDILTHERND